MDRDVDSKLINSWISAAALILIVFIVSSPKLVSFQIDKAMTFVAVGILIYANILRRKELPIKAFLAVGFMLFYILMGYVLNIPNSSPIVIFPVIGLLFVLMASQEKIFFKVLYIALLIHIFLGIVFVFSSYFKGMNSYVHPMYDKGVPFLHAAKGLTTTVQSYGTIVISWFFLFYFKKETQKLSVLDYIAYGIALVGLILTFNRNTVLTFYVLMFFKHRKLFFLSIVGLMVFYGFYFEFINKLIFNVSTLTSRADLLQAFRKAFFEQTSWWQYIIGHGNNIVDDAIARTTRYKTGYIENGTSVLLYTFGFAGYLAYLVAVFLLSILLFFKKHTFYACMVFYIFIIAQQFTHEFFSTTLYLQLTVVFLILNSDKFIEKKNRLFSLT